jgi:hypothetical protein
VVSHRALWEGDVLVQARFDPGRRDAALGGKASKHTHRCMQEWSQHTTCRNVDAAYGHDTGATHRLPQQMAGTQQRCLDGSSGCHRAHMPALHVLTQRQTTACT